MRPPLCSSIGLLFIGMNCFATAAAATYNIGAGFSATNNPTPSGVWQYGWSSQLTSTFHLYPQPGTSDFLQTWTDPALGDIPSVAYNPTGQLQDIWPPSTVGLHPGAESQYSKVRFTAPETELYYIALEFTGLDPATSDVHVIRNNALPSLFSGEVDGSGAIQEFFPPGLFLAQGDTIDFVVGSGSNGSSADTTAVYTTITKGCMADLVLDGVVDVDDLLSVINAWGRCDPKAPCPDLAPAGGNGVVDVDDLLAVINRWGPCD